MRKGFKALAVAGVAAASIGLATAPAFADSYSQYQSEVASVTAPGSTCFATMDAMHDDTTNYWVIRGAFYSSSTTCYGYLERRDDNGTWVKASNTYQFGPGYGWVRTGYHWDGPGASSEVCTSQAGGTVVCSALW